MTPDISPAHFRKYAQVTTALLKAGGMTTQQIADLFGITRQAAHLRLSKLVCLGVVQRRSVRPPGRGGHSIKWSVREEVIGKAMREKK